MTTTTTAPKKVKVLKRERDWLLNEKYGGKETAAFKRDLARLEEGVPLPYVIGFMPFLASTIHLDSKPLIPRVETEYWLSVVVRDMVLRARRGARVLDLCAGSGCIGVEVLGSLSDAHVDFAELDKKHHKTILKNISANEINPERARIFGGDLFEEIEDTYDYILCNPPYIDASLKRVQKSVLEHEPHAALFGGKDGLEVIERVINEGYKYLNKGGTIYIEHEPEQAREIREQLGDRGFRKVKTLRDQYDEERVTSAVRT